VALPPRIRLHVGARASSDTARRARPVVAIDDCVIADASLTAFLSPLRALVSRLARLRRRQARRKTATTGRRGARAAPAPSSPRTALHHPLLEQHATIPHPARERRLAAHPSAIRASSFFASDDGDDIIQQPGSFSQ